jgi:hypothetical protein
MVGQQLEIQQHFVILPFICYSPVYEFCSWWENFFYLTDSCIVIRHTQHRQTQIMTVGKCLYQSTHIIPVYLTLMLHISWMIKNKMLAAYFMLLSCLAYSSTMKMEVICSSKTLTFTRLHSIISLMIKLFNKMLTVMKIVHKRHDLTCVISQKWASSEKERLVKWQGMKCGLSSLVLDTQQHSICLG